MRAGILPTGSGQAMARKSSVPPPPPPRTELRESQESVRAKLQDRITRGQALLSGQTGARDLSAFAAEHEKWHKYNLALLGALFSTDELEGEYRWCAPVNAFPDVPREAELARRARDQLPDQLRCLASIVDRLELYSGGAVSVPTPLPLGRAKDLTRAFVVHGHDEAARESVARFLERLGIVPVILHEQANRGKTLIEKLEHYGAVSFAVVLLTPDDEGRQAGTDALRPRARQNVLLELGYFTGLLGRERVCALLKGALDVPSDWYGVAWVQMDDRFAWKFELARELKAAGFAVDLNAVF